MEYLYQPGNMEIYIAIIVYNWQYKLVYCHIYKVDQMDPKDFQQTTSGRVVQTRQGYWAFVPNPLPPEIEWDVELSKELAEATAEMVNLNNLGKILPGSQMMLHSFIRQEAVMSSRIEGTRTSLRDLYSFEIKQMSFLEEASDAEEVSNYVQSLTYGLVRMKSFPMSIRLIRELHRHLLEGVRGQEWRPGEFRQSQNWVGPPRSTIETAPYVPPQVEEMNQALYNLEHFIHTPSDVPTLVRVGLIHYQFEAIHPFLDGNGRVGRLIILLLFVMWGLLSEPNINLSAYFEANRQHYYDHLLAVSQKGAWKKWLLFFLRGVKEQAQHAYTLIAGLEQIYNAYERKLQSERAGERILKVVDFLLGHPLFNIQQVKDATGIPDRSVRRYIDKLTEMGMLVELTGFGRNRLFFAQDILRFVEGEESIEGVLRNIEG